MQNEMPYMTINMMEVTAYRIFFEVEPDEFRFDEDPDGNIKAVVAVYFHPESLPHKEGFKVIYKRAGVDKTFPLLSRAFRNDIDFQTMFNTVKNKEFFKRMREENKKREVDDGREKKRN